MSTAESEPINTQTSEEAEKDGARSAIILAIAVIVVAFVAVQFGLQILIWVESKSWASQNPWLTDTLQTIPSPTAPAPAAIPAANSKTSGPAQIKLYDYEFNQPWPGNTKVTRGQVSSEVRFDSGQVIVFFDPESELNVIRDMKSKNAAGYQQLTNVFGDQTPDSDYALYQLAYGASPASISPFMSRAGAVRVNGALLYKLGFGYDALPGIHSFDFGKNKGFEFGDPASGPVAVRVFNDRDDQFRLIFTVASGTGGKVTQDDVNTAVQSLQIIPLLER